MFGCFPVGQILRVVRVADKIRPRFSSSLSAENPFEHLSQRDRFSERDAVALLRYVLIALHPVIAMRD